MAIRKIFTEPDPILKKISKPVYKVEKEEQKPVVAQIQESLSEEQDEEPPQTTLQVANQGVFLFGAGGPIRC